MIHRLSELFIRTLREDPVDAEVSSHKLLVRAGYIRRQAPGVFAWLPIGLRVRQNVERIVHEEMARAGAQHIHFPALLPREPYEATGRWEEYGDTLFRLKDRKDADYLLAPTHEEAFTLMVKDLYTSYKDLPVTLYQIQDKYRDEARPRAGLLRGREFSMKDAYSFDIDDAGLAQSYQKQRDAYERIFARLGVDYVIVAADAGAMGGSQSEEFLTPIAIGEDTFVRSAGGYAANVEAYQTTVPAEGNIDAHPDAHNVATPDAKTIAAVVEQLNAQYPKEQGVWTAADTLKHLVLKLSFPDGSTEIVVAAIPGDRDLDQKRAEAVFSPAEVEPASEADLAQYPEIQLGYIGPVLNGTQIFGSETTSQLRYLVDPRVVKGSVWVAGANELDTHTVGLVYGRDFIADGVVDLANVIAGDPAPDGSGPVELARGIEIGHVFQLGRKYAEALGLQVLDENGRLVTVTMGSYGLGVTRIIAVMAEKFSDEKGLLWPKEVAPYRVQLVATGKDETPYQVSEVIAGQLAEAGLDVLYDDRSKVSPGVKFADAELLGVPNIIIIGKGLANNEVELWDRASGDRRPIALVDGKLPAELLNSF